MLGSDADIFRIRFGVLPDGNAPFDPQNEFVGKNLLYTARGIDEVMSATAKSREEVDASLARARAAARAALDAPAPASRRQGADRVERVDDRRVRRVPQKWGRRSLLEAGPPTMRRDRSPGRALHLEASLEPGYADAAAPLSPRRCRPSKAMRRTTHISCSACWSCSRRMATRDGSNGR